jgi:hypothetical protein
MRTYLVLAVAAVGAYALEIFDLNEHLTWPLAICAAVVLALIPFLLGRTEACPSCGSRKVEAPPSR